ncbi:hypothetical protein OKW21_004942 [Catalinimonas alkaloidigena]|uniref:right-handed parallel beta-helix repeat-containing protein n=1 Tax=Catalinimonas alkaloidigena TaxID=1075417 RepID=UPI0024053820|nr:right-handed parallel beta-helix repeat-containing protein [Catalinimonas alkaloidigena]MDF9799679.1 hypothetical protein [Catalinimonas alkaloidigena]
MIFTLQSRIYLLFLIALWMVFPVLTISAQPSGTSGTVSKNYSIPSGAYFAAPNGNGSAPCREGNPCSLSTALQKAPRGATIVLKGGTYRTSKYSTTIYRRLTIQPYPGANVTIKGSEIEKDWVASGNTWRTQWDDLFGKPNNDDGRAIKENPMADHRDMVYINGQSQKQVSSKSQVSAGKFYVDYSSKNVYIGTNPSGKQVEISAVWWGFNTYDLNESGVTIRGLKIMHYTDAGLFIGSPGTVIENCEVVWNGAAGIRVQHANDVVLKNNLFAYNACQGGGISYADRIKLINNSFKENNYENYNRNSWSASGVKLLWSKNAEVRNNSFVDNDANGLWLDERSNNSVIVHNFVKNSTRSGIHCEISNNVIIAGNVVLESGKHQSYLGKGISVANSSGVKVYNNTLYDNELALDVIENTRGDEKDPNDPYITRNTVIKNNILSEAFISEYPSSLYHMKKKNCGDNAISQQDNNAYYRSTAGDPNLAIRWKINNNSCNEEQRFETIQEFKNKLGFEKNGFGIQGGSEPFFVNAGSDNFKLKSSSMAIKAGAPLPSDVAQAMGWESGKVVDIGAYQTNISESQAPSPDTGTLPWKETFTTSDGSTSDNGLSDGSAWSLNRGNMSSNAAFNVQNNRLHARGAVGEGSWRSEQINIEGKEVNLSLMLYSQGDLEDPSDYVKVYTRVDGSEKLVKEVNGKLGSSGVQVKASNIKGKTLQLIVKFKNSDYTEFYFLDNVNVNTSTTTATPSKGIIEGMSIVVESTGAKVPGYTSLDEGETVHLDDLPSTGLNIYANLSKTVGSVVFDYNGTSAYQIENNAAYALQGNGGSYSNLDLQPGANSITIKAYSNSNGKGTLLDSKTINFNVKGDGGSGSSPSPSPSPSPSGDIIKSISVVKENTGEKVSGYTSITEGETIHLRDLPSADLNMYVNISGTVGSIVFDYNGVSRYQVEGVAPYALQGDGAGYRKLYFNVGSHTITIKAYSQSGGKGTLLDQKTINFNVKDDASPASNNAMLNINPLEVSVSPNPFVNDITINVEGATNNKVNLQITDYVGNEMFKRDQVSTEGSIYLNLSHLPSNIYILRVLDAAGNIQNIRLQKD